MSTNLSDLRTALVTGGTSGIGIHIAFALCGRGFRVIITGRDEARGGEALASLREAGGSAEFISVDHSSMAANRRLAANLSRKLTRLDVLVNNVGALFSTRSVTSEGLEATLAVSFAGPVAVTLGLLPLLQATDKPRIVNVVSPSFSLWKRSPFDDLELREKYVGIEADARAKLLKLIWTVALAQRMAGKMVANAVSPGMAWTPMTQSMTSQAFPARLRLMWPLVRYLQKRASPSKAALGPIHLALSEEAAQWTGRYVDRMRPRPLPSRAREISVQAKVWELGTSLATA